MKNKKIGIWGYGITGKAAVNFYHSQGYELAVIDKKELSLDDRNFLEKKNISYKSETHLEDFLSSHDAILPSPGIDLRSFSHHQQKWISELDAFHAVWQKPIIAITGSIGKTTVTHLFSKLLMQAKTPVALGGNYGIPMFDLLNQKEHVDYALLEVSSFQLELTKTFAPDLAIWTNFHPNHLDRHGTEAEYFNAKAKMLSFQNNTQHALLPLSFKNNVTTRATIHYFSLSAPRTVDLENIDPKSSIYYFNDPGHLIRYRNGLHENLLTTNHQKLSRASFAKITFDENWLILHSALDILAKPFHGYDQLDLPAHRMEKVATIDGIDFINDSKSTTAQSTLAAVECLQHRPVLLLLGGKGKGVNREPLVAALKNKVKKIYCFGAEAQELHSYGLKHSIQSGTFENLNRAFEAITKEMQSGDQVLLSPGGTSYDLYAIFSERGDHFKRLVKEHGDKS